MELEMDAPVAMQDGPATEVDQTLEGGPSTGVVNEEPTGEGGARNGRGRSREGRSGRGRSRSRG